MKLKPVDHCWAHLMELCESERRFRAEGTHPRLLKHIESSIEELAAHMGFNERCIATRDFRAESERGRIVRLLTDG